MLKDSLRAKNAQETYTFLLGLDSNQLSLDSNLFHISRALVSSTYEAPYTYLGTCVYPGLKVNFLQTQDQVYSTFKLTNKSTSNIYLPFLQISDYNKELQHLQRSTEMPSTQKLFSGIGPPLLAKSTCLTNGDSTLT